jgi:hypothetical protein
MGSDRARISYDKRRRYRGVVSQQGRVTLEADQNEDRLIGAELLREETLDIVGRSGTPDPNSFAVTQAADPFDITIGAGTMYVGGERVELETDLVYSSQSEWLDRTGDPDWLQPHQADPAGRRNELVYLYLEEHEVSAVEDTALLEVALGGPDTAQRLRLVQRIRRLPTTKTTCEDAMAELVDALGHDGLQRDVSTQQLTSPAALKVVYEDQGAAGTLCEPETQGGYLGAENQLLRVQTAGPDTDGNPTLVWGFDDASFLYRVQVRADLLTLTLASSPVDDYHKPAQGQVVEVLRTAAGLETGTDTKVEISPNDYVAALTGSLRTLQTGYDSTTKRVVLEQVLEPVYINAKETPVAFMRVWQERLTFTPDQPVKLGDTGVSVVLDGGGLSFHPGEYWQVAVRPKTPTEVYPVRYLEADATDTGEPPDGPRRWICPLAVIQWNDGTVATLDDCRDQFDGLVELTKRKGSGCCDVVVRPEDVHGTLQDIVNKFKGKDATICLAPGHYALKEPLHLGHEHSGLTIDACHGGAVLSAERGSEPAFRDGMIVLLHANKVTLRGLRFELPQAPFAPGPGAAQAVVAAQIARFPKAVASQWRKHFVSIGVRPMHCALLAVEDCLFRFTIPQGQNVFGVGIFAGSECWGLKVRGNSFVRDDDYLHESGTVRVIIGYLLAPSSAAAEAVTRDAGFTGRFTPSLLQDASFRDNDFHGLSIAALAYADYGAIEIDDNTVRLCEFGFLFFSLRSWDSVHSTREQADPATATILDSIGRDPVLSTAALLAMWSPEPADFAPTSPIELNKATVDPKAQAQRITQLATHVDRSFAGQDLKGQALMAARKTTTIDLPTKVLTSLSRANPDIFTALTPAVVLPRFDRGITPSLHCADNDIDLRIEGIESGFGLLVWDSDRVSRSAISMNGNRFSTAGPLPTVATLLIERSAVAANVIENEDGDGRSLVITPQWNDQTNTNDVAVTGNVLHGNPALPNRTDSPQPPPPLDQWYVFNAIS